MLVSYGHPQKNMTGRSTSFWDVGVERQVEIVGPTPPRWSRCRVRGSVQHRDWPSEYVAMCDHEGVLINDPVVLKLDDERYWLSIADNNMLIWTRAIAAERGYNVRV